MITEDDNGNKIVHRGGNLLEAAMAAQPAPEEPPKYGEPSLNMTTRQVFAGYVALGTQLNNAIDAYNGMAKGTVYDELETIAKFCEAAIRNCERLLANRVGRL